MSAEANSTTSASAPAKPLPELGKRVLTPAQLKLPNFRTGQKGEDQAILFLEKLGYQLIDTNVAVGRTEIDIIAFDRNNHELVFVEVKKRNSGIWGHPSQAVNWKKRRNLYTAARAYLRQQKLDYDYRFDIIAVTINKIEHFENITW